MIDNKPTLSGLILTGALICSLLAACSPDEPPSGPPLATTTGNTASPALSSTPSLANARPGRLTPYTSATASRTPTPPDPSTATPLPSPTPTLRSHVVEKGQDLFGIAWIYRVELEDLLAANPEVNPNFLSIGAKLSIPASNIPLPSSEAPSPTPVPLQIGELNCTGTPEGGAWCFLPVFNPQDHALENVSAIIRLADREAVTILPQTAYLPLDVLPQAATLPLVAYFAPPLPDPFVYSAELVSALPHPSDDGRYLAAVVEDVQVEIAENGLSASVDCVVRLEDENASAQTVRVAAVAFDARGNVAGVRRWEAGAGQALTGEQPAAVQLQIYSVDERITRVEVLAETRP